MINPSKWPLNPSKWPSGKGRARQRGVASLTKRNEVRREGVDEPATGE